LVPRGPIQEGDVARKATETDAIRDAVRSRAGGRCQCTHDECAHHDGRCGVHLGSRWDVRKKNAEASFSLWNLDAFCVRCDRNARVREPESSDS